MSRRHPMAYEVRPLANGTSILGIYKQTRILAIAGKDSRESELIGMAAAPMLARAIIATLRATTDQEQASAVALCTLALKVAGISLAKEAVNEPS